MRDGLSKYAIGQEVGRGTSGVVFEATSPLQERVAIKRFDVRKGSRESRAICKFFEQEATLVSQIKHPHIVRYVETGEDGEGAPYIVMSPLAIETLEQRLERKGSLSPHGAAILLGEIGSAIDYLHGKSVLHRDIKPSNVLFDENGTSYLSDFGIAHFAPSRERSTVVDVAASPGTPEFLAPEVMNGAPSTSASDIYSLAMTMYYALCQKLPTDGISPHLRNVDRTSGNLVALKIRNPSLSTHVSDVVMRGLEVDPKQRFRSAAEFAVAFANAESETASYLATRRETAPKDPQPKPWLEYWKVIIVPLLVAAIGGAAVWLKK